MNELREWRKRLQVAKDAEDIARETTESAAQQRAWRVAQQAAAAAHTYHQLNIHSIEHQERAEQAAGRDAESKAERERMKEIAKHGGPELAEHERLRQVDPTRAAVYAQLEPMALHAQREAYTTFLVEREDAEREAAARAAAAENPDPAPRAALGFDP